MERGTGGETGTKRTLWNGSPGFLTDGLRKVPREWGIISPSTHLRAAQISRSLSAYSAQVTCPLTFSSSLAGVEALTFTNAAVLGFFDRHRAVGV